MYNKKQEMATKRSNDDIPCEKINDEDNKMVLRSSERTFLLPTNKFPLLLGWI